MAKADNMIPPFMQAQLPSGTLRACKLSLQTCRSAIKGNPRGAKILMDEADESIPTAQPTGVKADGPVHALDLLVVLDLPNARSGWAARWPRPTLVSAACPAPLRTGSARTDHVRGPRPILLKRANHRPPLTSIRSFSKRGSLRRLLRSGSVFSKFFISNPASCELLSASNALSASPVSA